jgi:hypothetical protein
VIKELSDYDKTRQDKTRQDKTRQDKTRQDKTRQDKTRQDKSHVLLEMLVKENIFYQKKIKNYIDYY